MQNEVLEVQQKEKEGKMILNPQETQELLGISPEKLANIKTALTLKVENIVMSYPADSWIEFSCEKCSHRQLYQRKLTPFFVDGIVNFIMELGEKSEAYRQILIMEFAEEIQKGFLPTATPKA